MKNRRDLSKTYQVTLFYIFDGEKTRKTFKFEKFDSMCEFVTFSKMKNHVWKIIVKECFHCDWSYDFTLDTNVMEVEK